MPITKDEHRNFYASMSKTCGQLPTIRTRRHKSPQRKSPQRLRSLSPDPSSPGPNAHKANVLASWRPVLDFEMDNCDLDVRQLDGRDYFSLLGVTPEASAAEIDIAYNKCRHEWDSCVISGNLSLFKKELNDVGAKYRLMEALLRQAHTALSYTAFRQQYADHIRARDDLLFSHLPAWTRGLSNVIPSLPSVAMGMLRGFNIKIPTTVLIGAPGSGGHRVFFNNSRGEIRMKRDPIDSPAKLVAMLAGENTATDKLPGTRIVGLWQNSPSERVVMAECVETEALQILEGGDETKMMLQQDVGQSTVYRSNYKLDRSMVKFEQWTECVEDIKGTRVGKKDFVDCRNDERKMRMVEILSAHTRGAVSHLERTHDCRVLLICIQYLVNPEGAVFLSQVVLCFTSSIRPWCQQRSDAAWIEMNSVQHLRNMGAGSPEPERPPNQSGELLTEAELSSTWPLLRAAPRTEGAPPLLQTHFSVEPVRGNNWSKKVRKKPDQSVAPNFRKHSYTSYVRRKGKEQMVLNQKQNNMQQVSLNAHIIRGPFMSDRFSLSVPGRFMESKAIDLTKPWEMTSRTNFSQLWTAPIPKDKRRGPDPYGLEIRNLQKETMFDLEQLYELYGHFFRFTKTPDGDKDREACGQPVENFVEHEFEAMLAKCGINIPKVSQRIFVQFSHTVGFGRKKRTLLSFYNATLAICAFGMSTRERQALSLLQIMDEDGGGSVSRAELLAFIEAQSPAGGQVSKLELFKRVSTIFGKLDEDGGGEIDKEEWVSGFVNDEEVYAQFEALVPYKRFFAHWEKGDNSLKPILVALAAADPEDNFSILNKQKQESLRQRARDAIAPHVTRNRACDFMLADVAIDIMVKLGVDTKWAKAETDKLVLPDTASAVQLEGMSKSPKISVPGFVERMVLLGEMNPIKFDQLTRTATPVYEAPKHPVLDFLTLSGGGLVF